MEQFDQQPIAIPAGSTTAAMSGAFPLLRSLTFFDGISDADLKGFAALMREVTYRAGEFVYRQGTPTDGMYVIAEGQVQLWTRVADTRHDMPRLGPGNVVCEAAIAETHGRHLNAECVTDARAWVLDLATFETLRHRANPVAYAVLISAARNMALTMRAAFRFFGAHVDHAPLPDAPRAFEPRPASRAWGAAEYPLLRVIPTFKAWSDEQLADLARRSQLVDLPRGHQLLGEGQAGGTIYLVVRGALEVSTTRPSGRFRHGLRGPGHTVGHEAVSDGSPEMFDVTAKESSLLLVLPQASLDALVKEGSPIAGHVLAHLCSCVQREFSADCKHFVKELAERDIHPATTLDAVMGSGPRS